MGDNRSNTVFRLSGIAVRFAFVSMLLCSVAMPYQALAADDLYAAINDGTELRTALLQGFSSITLTSKGDAAGGFSIPNPGQEFINKVYHDETWLTAENYDLSFMGEVTFQDGFFVQKPAFSLFYSADRISSSHTFNSSGFFLNRYPFIPNPSAPFIFISLSSINTVSSGFKLYFSQR